MGDKANIRDMMGSKADMISMRIDEVSRNQIWREHVQKEDKKMRDPTPFQLNRKTMVPIPPKPTQSDPRTFASTLGAASVDENELGSLSKSLDQGNKDPHETSLFPNTESQEVGWLHKEYYKPERFQTNKRWYKGVSSCSITKYAAAYTTMSKTNPFADKSTR